MNALRRCHWGLLLLLGTGCGGPSAPTVDEAALPPSFTNSLGMKVVKIPSGTFVMGEEGLEKFNTEGKSASVPLHEVELSCFYLADKEVTKAQFREYVKARGFSWDRFPQVDPEAKLPPPPWDTRTLTPSQRYLLVDMPGDDWPIIDVSWEEAMDFCRWLSEKEGRRYRLPTEAEWEYACRAGTRTVFWWGNKPDSKKERIGGNYVKFDDYLGTMGTSHAPVGRYEANPWGLYDMHGNVSEWVMDYFDWDYYARSPRKDPQGPMWGTERVNRGGGVTIRGATP